MIYLVHPDIHHYQSFVIDSKEARRKLGDETKFHFDPRPIEYAQDWKPIEIGFTSVSNRTVEAVPDIMVRNGRVFLSLKAHDILHDLLESQGEFLPVMYGNQRGYIFNILSVAEDVGGLDEKRSTKNEYGDLQSLAFHEKKVSGIDIFRTEFDSYMGVYASDAFKDLVESSGLKGVAFSVDLGNIFPPDPDAQEPPRH
jgi:hypothetical protein